MKTIDDLLKTPYWVIDILPKQVPMNSPGQYFRIENYLLKARIGEIKQQHINLILKLNCYLDISMDDEPEINPAAELIDKTMRTRYVNIRIGDALIVSEPDDTNLTMFNANKELLKLVRLLASAEGLFVWRT